MNLPLAVIYLLNGNLQLLDWIWSQVLLPTLHIVARILDLHHIKEVLELLRVNILPILQLDGKRLIHFTHFTYTRNRTGKVRRTIFKAMLRCFFKCFSHNDDDKQPLSPRSEKRQRDSQIANLRHILHDPSFKQAGVRKRPKTVVPPEKPNAQLTELETEEHIELPLYEVDKENVLKAKGVSIVL
jgi:hypothetical protein